MNYKALLVAVCLMPFVVIAQTPPMGTSTGLTPGNSFTLFISFQEPMQEIGGMNCVLTLVTPRKPGQEDFQNQVSCEGNPVKDDDKNYHIKVGIPQGIADGDYKVTHIGMSIGNATHQYEGKDLPNPPQVTITNHEHLKFSDIKKLEVK
jgi:hypothetical protein